MYFITEISLLKRKMPETKLPFFSYFVPLGEGGLKDPVRVKYE